jgi:dihydrodipicolinate synthase/N-acetylneuraminate lyase
MIYSAALTPLTEKSEIDIESLEKMLERNLAHGIKGFFVLGSMGEGILLDTKQSKKMLGESSRILKGRAELLAGINAAGLEPALRIMDEFSGLDFDSYVVVLPSRPFFYDPVKFMEKILEHADRPVYYYHCPPRNGINFSSSDIEKFLGHPRLKGIKNSSGSMPLRKELIGLKKKYDFILFEGHEWAIDEALVIGCDGALSGMASLASKPMVKICEAAKGGDFQKALDLQLELIDVFYGVYGRKLETITLGHKYAMEKLGVFNSHKSLIQNEDALTKERRNEIEVCLETHKEFLD